ncbi:MAG: uroporphyrinogen decarboxylase family protein [Armatimonadota bacterium]|nr:uroporphyrinogen decarboxylase family protein [Armatimonadota bacterium]
MAQSAQLALDTILQKPTKGIPSWMLHIMEHSHIERLAGVEPGEYMANPEETYLAMQRNIGTCLLDQYLWDNPLTMGNKGYENRNLGATTGAHEVIVDGMVIDSAEAVVEHMEKFVFPKLQAAVASFDEDARSKQIIEREHAIQKRLGPTILKSGHGFASFPTLAYGTYGYVHYFSAYGLYPEIMEKHFSLQADLALLNNKAAARAYVEGNLPPLYRMDHDMADSRGTLVRIETLDRLWFPHFARCLEPLIKVGVRLIWHCDGNLMEMVPRLLDVGLRGFQGFQYEDGMDYERICRMKARDGSDLIIIAGVSVTKTLPFGKPSDIKREIAWLVEKGPKTGLFLGASSSIVPGTPWENIKTLVEGLRYYRTHGRSQILA